jgi:hypothetical protein
MTTRGPGGLTDLDRSKDLCLERIILGCVIAEKCYS